MIALANTAALILFASFVFAHATDAQEQNRYAADDFAKVEKIDIHFHLHSDDLDFIELAKRDRFSILNIATQSAPADVMREKHRIPETDRRVNPIRPVTRTDRES